MCCVRMRGEGVMCAMWGRGAGCCVNVGLKGTV